MNEERYEQLQQAVTRLSEEGFVPEGKEITLFRNADEAIAAIRANKVPGVVWTEECEQKWQMQERLTEVVHSQEEEEDEDWDWGPSDIFAELDPEAQDIFCDGFNLSQELNEGWEESF